MESTKSTNIGERHFNSSCDYCRKRKIRCDKGIPACFTCVSKNFECHYTAPLKRGPKGSRCLKPYGDLKSKGTENNIVMFSSNKSINISPILTDVQEKGSNHDGSSIKLDEIENQTDNIPVPSNSSSVQEKVRAIVPQGYNKVINDDIHLAKIVYIFMNEVFLSRNFYDILKSIDRFTLKCKEASYFINDGLDMFFERVDHYITEMVTVNIQICKRFPSFPIFQGSFLTYLRYIKQIQRPYEQLGYYYEKYCQPRLPPDQVSDYMFACSYTINSFLAASLPKVCFPHSSSTIA